VGGRTGRVPKAPAHSGGGGAAGAPDSYILPMKWCVMYTAEVALQLMLPTCRAMSVAWKKPVTM